MFNGTSHTQASAANFPPKTGSIKPDHQLQWVSLLFSLVARGGACKVLFFLLDEGQRKNVLGGISFPVGPHLSGEFINKVKNNQNNNHKVT